MRPTCFRCQLLVSLAFVHFTAPLHSQPIGRIVEVHIPAPSLAGNLLGDMERQAAFVYLPLGYEEEADLHYPVLYLLHGVLDSPEVWIEPVYDGMTIQATMDSLIAAGEIGPAIVVMPNGRNAYGGSYYANSPVSGNWADFIARDLVAHVDATYRTIPARESRAILGHSMGGLGAIRLCDGLPRGLLGRLGDEPLLPLLPGGGHPPGDREHLGVVHREPDRPQDAYRVWPRIARHSHAGIVR